MAYNICDNIATHGPFYQHQFMGCSIESFNMSVGLNEQGSELSVNIVQDCAIVPDGGRPKVRFDEGLVINYGYDADPGFLNPGVGSPLYFRTGGMEFGGLLQSWTKKESTDGRPKYSVRLVDPRQILEGTQIILNNYSASVGSCYNLINVFGFMERFGSNAVCVPFPFEPTCTEAYATALGFGGANVDENGMPWNRVRVGIHVLTSATPKNANIFSPFGRLVFKGAKVAGYGILPPDSTDINLYNDFGGSLEQSAAYHDGNICFYTVDLSELPVLPDEFRLSGDSMSLLEIISQVCDAASCDYYIELLYTPNGVDVLKTIKVRVISRADQPLLQSLDTYVNANQTVDFSIGNELRNETTTVFLSGAHKESIYEVSKGTELTDEDGYKTWSDSRIDPVPECLDDIVENEKDRKILPFMGLDYSGNALIPNFDAVSDTYTWNNINVRTVKLTLEGDFGIADDISVSENEILCALIGYDAWIYYLSCITDAAGDFVGTESYQLIDVDYVYVKREQALGNIAGLPQGAKVNPLAVAKRWLKHPAQQDVARQQQLDRNFQKMYQFISDFAQNYGKKWMVIAPNVCVRRDSITGKFLFSEEGTESAWTDLTTVMGIDNPSTDLDFFSDESYKVRCFVKYSANLDAGGVPEPKIDYSKLSSNSYLRDGNENVYVFATVEEGFVYPNIDNLCSPRFVITLEDSVSRYTGTASVIRTNGADAIILAFDDAARAKVPPEPILTAAQRANLKSSLMGSQFEKAVEKTFSFNAIAIPVKSNINRYGPWITAGPPGQIRFEINEDLHPANYGGTNAMCTAAALLSNEGVSFQQAVESGSVTVPGYPVYNGGSEFGSVVGGKNLVENRSYNTEGFSETAVDEDEETNIDYIYVPTEQGGAWSGQFGPIITDINVDVGPQGVQTTYSFRTYTSKTGKMNKLNAERIKHLGQREYKLRKNLNALLKLARLNKRNSLYGRKPGEK